MYEIWGFFGTNDNSRIVNELQKYPLWTKQAIQAPTSPSRIMLKSSFTFCQFYKNAPLLGHAAVQSDPIPVGDKSRRVNMRVYVHEDVSFTQN